MADRVTPEKLDLQAAQMTDIYQNLEAELFSLIIKRLNVKGISGVDKDSIFKWQLDRLSDMDALNEDTIKAVANATAIAYPVLVTIIKKNGIAVYNQVNDSLSKTHKRQKSAKEVENLTNRILNGLMDQTKGDLDNYINETLITRSAKQDGEVASQYRQIITDAVAETATGTTTLDKAVEKAVYKCINTGMKSGLTNAAGNRVGVQGYVRTVVNTTTFRTFNQITQTTADGWGVHTFVMSSHAAARPACAPIQGHVIINVPTDEASPEESKYPSIYDYDYGKPAGTLGINCRHTLTEFDPRANTNTLTPPDPNEAIANHAIMQQQRQYERMVRKYKQLQKAAEDMGDKNSANHYSQLVKDNQNRIRQLVNKNSFLYRDYEREKM